jgi:uridylate kinase
MQPVYKRVVVKISGEAIGKNGQGFDADIISEVAERIIELNGMGVEVGLVIGAGNIWRGRQGAGMDMVAATANYRGMLGTVINALCMQDAIERLGKGKGPGGGDVEVRVMSAIEMRQFAEPFISRRAIRHLQKGRIVIFAGGTGNPFFTTDSAAALRAVEIAADAVLLAKNTDYIYDDDPKINPDAKPIEQISYIDVLNRGLRVMDSTALTLCMENDVRIYCFALRDTQNILRVACGEKVGTVVGNFGRDER